MDVPRRRKRYPRLRHALALVLPALVAVVLLAGALTASLRLALRGGQGAPAPLVPSVAVAPAALPAVCGGPPPGARVVEVEIPEVYELANVALTLTDYATREPHTAWRRGAYYAAVLDHFGPFRDHPLIERLDRELSGAGAVHNYYAFRESSAAYAFADRGIVRTTERRYWPQDRFAPLVAELEDFAAATGFRAFFAAQRAQYDAQLEGYRRQVPLRTMWEWLELRFPQRYRRYRVVFSPLINGSHSTNRFAEDGEIVMFIGGPAITEDAGPDLAALGLARIVFTEIDHNYVNPTTNRYLDRVAEVFSDLAAWNTDPVRLYDSAYATFNEYMTWAVFSLYIRDTEPGALAAATASLERVMLRRGFPRFPAFNEALLALAAQADSPCIAGLYPGILDWVAQWPGHAASP